MDLTRSWTTTLVTPQGDSSLEEAILQEEAVEVTLNEELVGTSMVLPENLEEFALGFLFGQGYISRPEDVVEVLVCPQRRVTVYARIESSLEEMAEETVITSGCGGTGKIARRFFSEDYPPLAECRLDFQGVSALIKGTLGVSPLQQMTHCVHACGFWSGGAFQAAYEDVGRHNAVDKVIGAILLRHFQPAGAMYTTGRLTSDMVLKCARMGIPIVLSRTAPSSLGVDIAKQAGMTLIGYARPGRLNVFTGPERIVRDGLNLAGVE